MTLKEFQQLAMLTKKEHATKKDQIIDALLGLSGETGEVAEMFKKHYSYGRELDVEDVKSELGDILWYVAEMCDAFDITVEDCAEKIIGKLKARHGDKFKGFGDRSGQGK